jgi:hypothetical protein
MQNQPPPPPQTPTQPQMTYVDRPEISETFADSLYRISFDSLQIRMEFVVNRFDDPQAGVAPTGKAITACRVVMPLPGMIDMHAKLSAIIQTLQAQNVLRTVTQPPTSGRPN